MRVFSVLVATGMVARVATGLGAEIANDIQAIVHDGIVTYQDVQDLSRKPIDELLRQYGRQPELFRTKVVEVERANLEQLLARQLILHEFKTAGYSMPESVIDDVVQERIRAGFRDRMTLIKMLEEKGSTYEKFREQIRDTFIIEQMRVKNVSSEVIVSPHKVEAYYQAHSDEFKVEDRVKLRMIETTKASDPNAPSGRALADEILAKLNQGTPFDDMAAEIATVYPQRSQRKPGGEWFERSGLRKELADGVVGLRPGQHSGVIETPDSCYLLQVDEAESAHLKPIGEVREQIERSLVLEERSRLEKQWIDRLKKKTFVRYFE